MHFGAVIRDLGRGRKSNNIFFSVLFKIGKTISQEVLAGESHGMAEKLSGEKC